MDQVPLAGMRVHHQPPCGLSPAVELGGCSGPWGHAHLAMPRCSYSISNHRGTSGDRSRSPAQGELCSNRLSGRGLSGVITLAVDEAKGGGSGAGDTQWPWEDAGVCSRWHLLSVYP